VRELKKRQQKHLERDRKAREKQLEKDKEAKLAAAKIKEEHDSYELKVRERCVVTLCLQRTCLYVLEVCCTGAVIFLYARWQWVGHTGAKRGEAERGVPL
jgi:hypothetical protein